MRVTTSRTLLTVLGLTSWLAAPVSAYFYCKFPKKIVCPGGVEIPQNKLEETARRAKEGTVYEKSAANIASGLCSNIRLPYYIQDVIIDGNPTGVAIGVAYAWDKTNPGFYYCLHTDPTFQCKDVFDPNAGQSENYCPQVIEN